MIENKRKKGKLDSWINLEKKKIEFIEKDMEELGLDENCTISIMSAKEIESSLGNEFPDSNVYFTEDNLNKNNIVVISGYSPSKEKDVKLYYSAKEQNLIRQLREYNYKGELKEIHTVGTYKDGTYFDLEDGSIQYAYDENGFKKYAKIDSSLKGEEYWIFNEDGKVEFEITDEYVRQFIIDGDKEYTITDGYFRPTDNGFTYLPSKLIEKLRKEDIKRVVYGNISNEEKELIRADLTEERKEQIINAIKLIPELEWFTQEVELDYLEELRDEETVYTNPTPEEVVEESIRESVEELRKSGKPYRFEQFMRDSKLEEHIRRVYGGDEFLTKLLEYAKRKSDLIERNGQAKDLLNEYEEQSNKDKKIQGNEN